jgi:hypothetical protein
MGRLILLLSRISLFFYTTSVLLSIIFFSRSYSLVVLSFSPGFSLSLCVCLSVYFVVYQ